MSLEVRPVQDARQWDEFVLAWPGSTFLHSWNWGQVNHDLGSELFRLGLFARDELQGVALLLHYRRRTGSFLYAPHGPLLDWQDGQAFSALLETTTALARQARATYIRFSPVIADRAEHRQLFRDRGFIGAPTHLHVEHTWVLDLRPELTALLAGMRRNARTGIRKGQEAGVEVVERVDPSALPILQALHRETMERHQITTLPWRVIQREAEVFMAAGQAALFLAYWRDQPVSAVLVIFFGNRAYAHHGASATWGQPSYASYLLQWRIIQAARARGCTHYDFWGIAPVKDPGHPWAGFSFWKRGFGGIQIDYLHAQDLPLRTGYWLNHFLERRRHRRLGFPPPT